MRIKSSARQVSFDGCVNGYDQKDGFLAVFCYLYELVIIISFGLLMFHTSVYGGRFAVHFANRQFGKFIFYIPVCLLQLLPVFIFIKIRGQAPASVGLKTTGIFKSILLGILFSLPFILPSVIQAMRQGRRVLDFPSLIWSFFYFLLEIALVEELVFRGFIQTRIQGLIRNKWLSIIAVGILFSAMHIPFQMMKANLSFSAFVARDSVHLITTFLLHIYFVYLYTRDNNIVSTTVAHTMIDFVPGIFI